VEFACGLIQRRRRVPEKIMLTKETVPHFNSSRSRPMSAHCDEHALAGARTCATLTGGSFVLISLGHPVSARGFTAPAAAKPRIKVPQKSAQMSSNDLALVSNMRLNFTRSFETF
jgi:hypothetical protein